MLRFQSASRSRERDDVFRLSEALEKPVFQSASRSRERDDHNSRTPHRPQHGFNPRPALASGTTSAMGGTLRENPVSIRVPLSRAGRRGYVARASLEHTVSIRVPLSRAGRLPLPLPLRVFQAVSIRVPLSRAGRLLRDGADHWILGVSIRVPLSRAGRLASRNPAAVELLFQSASRSRERDD